MGGIERKREFSTCSLFLEFEMSAHDFFIRKNVTIVKLGRNKGVFKQTSPSEV